MKKKCKNVDITNFDFILKSVEQCFQNKKKNRTDILKIREEVGTNVDIALMLQKELINKDIKLKPIWYRTKYDSASRKWRTIGIQDIKQQIYDYIAVNGLEELMRRVGKYQCASIKGRGQVYCAKAIYNHIQNPSIKYACKFDVRKYYESIPQDKMMEWLRKRVKNDLLLWLIETLIHTFKKGLSIGSYLSQHLGNLYLSDVYHKIESIHAVRRGKKIKIVSFTCTYMDDLLITGSNSRSLIKVGHIVENMCSEKGLTIKDTWSCFKIDDSFIDMVGYRIHRDHITIRRCTLKKIRRAIIRFEHNPTSLSLAKRVNSYKGILDHSDSYQFCKKYNVYETIRKARRLVSYYDRHNQIGCTYA